VGSHAALELSHEVPNKARLFAPVPVASVTGRYRVGCERNPNTSKADRKFYGQIACKSPMLRNSPRLHTKEIRDPETSLDMVRVGPKSSGPFLYTRSARLEGYGSRGPDV
jgi:hypothetical protein